MTIQQLRKKIQNHKKPLVILIGGMSGTGKSLTAVQLATALHWPIVIATDQIRDIMALRSRRRILHARCTNAWKLFGTYNSKNFTKGIREHSEAIKPGVVAIVNQCLSRGEDVIVEGTHLLPSCYKNIFDTTVLHFLLITHDTKYHTRMFREKYEQRHHIPLLHASKKIRMIREVQNVLLLDSKKSNAIPIEQKGVKKNCEAILTILKKRFGDKSSNSS